MKKSKVRQLVAIAIMLSVVGLTSCSNNVEVAPSKIPTVTVTKQWARTSPEATEMGAAYMTLNSDIDDELIGAAVDTSVAQLTEVHEIVMLEGAMKMQEIKALAVTANTPTELAPGGYHIMLMGLGAPLTTGSTFTVTLTFKKAGDVVVEVPVMEDAP
jgi:hypothetical protein